jgi:hypothetical protein
MVDVELLYRQQLTASDVAVLSEIASRDGSLTEVLASPALEEAVFASPDGMPMARGISPFLAFATAVHRTAATLEKASFVEERWGPRTRIPLFDVSALRALLSDQLRVWFLVDLLSSYTRVSSGVTWTRTAGGWRRRRFSELNPLDLAEQLQLLGPAEQAGVYRRLGDLALFLLGVFPDHRPSFTGASGDRLLRLSGVRLSGTDPVDGQVLLERLGSRWYSAAVASAHASGNPVTAPLAVAGHMGEHFSDARRVLNAVTDRYLFPIREHWFGR